MPTEQGESATDDLNDPATPTASDFPQSQEEPEEEAPEGNQSEAMQPEQEEETGQVKAGQQSHVIKNVDEIFHTIEGLMSKLRHLKVSWLIRRSSNVGDVTMSEVVISFCVFTGSRSVPSKPLKNPPRAACQSGVGRPTVSLGDRFQDPLAGPRLRRR